METVPTNVVHVQGNDLVRWTSEQFGQRSDKTGSTNNPEHIKATQYINRNNAFVGLYIHRISF
jgi:hypothetical protein